MTSCVLYQDEERTVTLLDIPRSIELAQGFLDGDKPRIISSQPSDRPYASNDPKSANALAKSEEPSIQELLLQRHLELALVRIREASPNAWFLPRRISRGEWLNCHSRERRKFPAHSDNPDDEASNSQSKGLVAASYNHSKANRTQTGRSDTTSFIPSRSKFILGSIEDSCSTFIKAAPCFDLVIMDPPWPNRSVRRKKSYKTPYGTSGIMDLLSSVPLRNHLAQDALVGLWVTNKPAFRDVVLGGGGLFEQWGLDLEEEWIWLKITASGEPIFALNSVWRKPYETLLLGRSARRVQLSSEVKRRVIVGVPDLHSRKPNLKALLEPMLPGKYEALEIFARNLTAGWWAWGNEVLKFQGDEHWE